MSDTPEQRVWDRYEATVAAGEHPERCPECGAAAWSLVRLPAPQWRCDQCGRRVPLPPPSEVDADAAFIAEMCAMFDQWDTSGDELHKLGLLVDEDEAKYGVAQDGFFSVVGRKALRAAIASQNA